MVHSVVSWVVKRYSTLLCYTKLVKSCRRRVHFSDLQLSVAHFLLLTTDALGQDYIFTGNLNLATNCDNQSHFSFATDGIFVLLKWYNHHFSPIFFKMFCFLQDAVDWLCDQPYVKPGGVGIVGVSFGATLALQTSALFPKKVKVKDFMALYILLHNS